MTMQRLTDKEKEELKKLLEAQDKIGDTSWLMVEEYKKKKSKFKCILCEKTHSIKNCPNSSGEEHKYKGDSEYTGPYYSQYSYGDE